MDHPFTRSSESYLYSWSKVVSWLAPLMYVKTLESTRSVSVPMVIWSVYGGFIPEEANPSKTWNWVCCEIYKPFWSWGMLQTFAMVNSWRPWMVWVFWSKSRTLSALEEQPPSTSREVFVLTLLARSYYMHDRYSMLSWFVITLLKQYPFPLSRSDCAPSSTQVPSVSSRYLTLNPDIEDLVSIRLTAATDRGSEGA